MLTQLYDAHRDLIPLVWDVDDTWGGNRYSWYPGNGYVPWISVGGNIEPAWNSYTSYNNAYNTTAAVNSSLEMTVSAEILRSQLVVTADIEVTEVVTSTNNKLFFVISFFVENASADYVNKVVAYSGERNFNLTQIGQTVQEQHTFTLNPTWDISLINAVAIVQSWSGTKDILQADQTKIPPGITVITPNGGENWIFNSIHDITWSSVNTSDNVKIELFKDDVFYSTIVSSTNDDGIYNWQIPDTYEQSPHYKIKISDITDIYTFDQSNDYFGISPPPEPEINVNVIELSSNLGFDETDAQTFEISNVGDTGSNLTYEINWEYTTSRAGARPFIPHTGLRGTPHSVISEIRNFESWLEISPTSGDCNFSETDVIDVTFDSTELLAGTYTAIITITNNADIDQYINATLEVTGSRGVNNPDDITFEAWITIRPEEILNESTPGCNYFPDSGYLMVQCGNFDTQWNSGEIIHINVTDPSNDYSGFVEVVLTSAGYDITDPIYLSAVITPAPPEITNIYDNGSSVYIEWNMVTGASSYTVYSCPTPDGIFPDDWSVEESGYTDLNWNQQLTENRKFYIVTANN